jgi:hypothetical protein
MKSSKDDPLPEIELQLERLDQVLESYLSRDEGYYVREASKDVDASRFAGDDATLTAETLKDLELAKLQACIVETLNCLSRHLTSSNPNINTRPFGRLIRDLHALQMGNKPTILARPTVLPSGSAKVREVTWGRIPLAAAMEYAINLGEKQATAAKRLAPLAGCKPDVLRDLSKAFRNHPENLPSAVYATFKSLVQSMHENERRLVEILAEEGIEVTKTEVANVQNQVIQVMINHYLEVEKGV